jgi:hypothetical protein
MTDFKRTALNGELIDVPAGYYADRVENALLHAYPETPSVTIDLTKFVGMANVLDPVTNFVRDKLLAINITPKSLAAGAGADGKITIKVE